MKKKVISILSALTGAVLGAGAVGRITTDKIKKNQIMSDKHLALFLMMNQWVKVKQEGKKISDFLEAYSYKKIAIYGMSYAGETLLEELRNTGITVAYGIDQNADYICSDVDVVSVDDKLEEVDAVIVTAITFFEEIEKKLCSKMDCPIFSMEDILYKI